MRQLQLINAKPFRTRAQRLAYIRGQLDRIREERAARKRLRWRRITKSFHVQPSLFLEREVL